MPRRRAAAPEPDASGHALVGTVTYLEAPVPEAVVTIWSITHVAPDEDCEVVLTTVADPGGRFRFDGVPAGDYRIRAVRHRSDRPRGQRERDRIWSPREPPLTFARTVSVPSADHCAIDIPAQATLTIRCDLRVPGTEEDPSVDVTATRWDAWHAQEYDDAHRFESRGRVTRLDRTRAIEWEISLVHRAQPPTTWTELTRFRVRLEPGDNYLLVRADGSIKFPATEADCREPEED